MARPKKGAEVVVRIDGFDKKGRGVGLIDDVPIWVVGAIPGQKIRARVVRRRLAGLDGHLLELLERSPDQVEPRCDHVGTCGGCASQELIYARQLEHLQQQIIDALKAVEIECAVPPVLGCEPPFNYRNKMDFTFSAHRWVMTDEPEDAPRDFALGMHVRGRFDKVLDLHGCALPFEESNGLMSSARDLTLELGLAPWDVHAHTGLMRHLVLRKAFGTGEIMVDIVTSDDAPDEIGKWADAMRSRHPEITTIVQNVNTRPASVAVGEREHILFGPGTITEQIGDLSFLISANSFFQTNTRQADVLFRVVREMAAPTGEECVWDLYCGTGALSLVAAQAAREVYGFELIASAVADARRNAERNGLTNASFIEGDVMAAMTADEPPAPPPDLVIVDPPRVGLHHKVVNGLLALAPRRIVYVSCNVHTAAPQIAQLCSGGGYRIERVQPVDMFPHTPHVECAFRLVR